MDVVLVVIGCFSMVAALYTLAVVKKIERSAEKKTEDAARYAEALKDLEESIERRLQGLWGAISTSQQSVVSNVNGAMSRSLLDYRDSITKEITQLRAENNRQIEAIRASVEEKLDKQIEKHFTESFSNLREQMNALLKSMGELSEVGGKVASLESTLKGTKTRGIAGEIHLKNIIAEVLTPAQYEVEFSTIPNSSNRVEVAVKIPNRDNDGVVYLPIDSKFHLDVYEQLVDAYNRGDSEALAKQKKVLRALIINDANDIASKYIADPYTTRYAILFVPIESMYVEIVNLEGITEELNKLHITVAGPSTLLAILSTVSNYFQSLALANKSQEIEQTLGRVKKEVENYNKVLESISKKFDETSKKFSEATGTRFRAVERTLRNIETGDIGLIDDEYSDYDE